MAKALSNANYCCQCHQTFLSTYASPDVCSRCGSDKWNELKKYDQSLFDQGDDEA